MKLAYSGMTRGQCQEGGKAMGKGGGTLDETLTLSRASMGKVKPVELRGV